MNRIMFIIICLFFYDVSHSQCSTRDLFPFAIGMDKLSIMNTISENDNISYPDEYVEGFNRTIDEINNKWKSYPYLKEQVYTSVVNLKNKNLDNKCLSAYDNSIQLILSDDYLYKFLIRYQYKHQDYDKMLSDYDRLLKLHFNIYPFDRGYTVSDSETNEKVGEGFEFYENSEKDRNPIKPKYLKISYRVIYKYESNTVDYYEIQIFKVDTNGTKLTSEQY